MSRFLPPFAESIPPMRQPLNVGAFSALDTIPDADMSVVPGVSGDPSMVPEKSRQVSHQQVTDAKTVTLISAGAGFNAVDCFTPRTPLFMRCLHSEKTLALNSLVFQGLSLFAINKMLRSPYGRRVYGVKHTAVEVLRDWHYEGIQMADEEELKNSGSFVGMSVLIDGPTDNVPNIWLAETGAVAAGSEAYLLLVRRRLDEDEELKDIVPAASSSSSSSSRISSVRRAALSAAHFASSAHAPHFGYDEEVPVVEFFDGDGDDDGKSVPAYYWRFEPVACMRRCRPQKERYNNLTSASKADLFAGVAMHLGTIEWCDLPTKVSPDDADARAIHFKTQARNLLYNVALGSELRRSLLTMPTCTLHTVAEAHC